MTGTGGGGGIATLRSVSLNTFSGHNTASGGGVTLPGPPSVRPSSGSAASADAAAAAAAPAPAPSACFGHVLPASGGGAAAAAAAAAAAEPRRSEERLESARSADWDRLTSSLDPSNGGGSGAAPHILVGGPPADGAGDDASAPSTPALLTAPPPDAAAPAGKLSRVRIAVDQPPADGRVRVAFSGVDRPAACDREGRDGEEVDIAALLDDLKLQVWCFVVTPFRCHSLSLSLPFVVTCSTTTNCGCGAAPSLLSEFPEPLVLAPALLDLELWVC